MAPTLCSAKDVPSVLRRGGIAAVVAAYGAQRAGLFLKVLCQDAGRLAAWADRFGVTKSLCPGGTVPHLDLTGERARRILAAIESCAEQEGGRGCVRAGATAAS